MEAGPDPVGMESWTIWSGPTSSKRVRRDGSYYGSKGRHTNCNVGVQKYAKESLKASEYIERVDEHKETLTWGCRFF